MNDKLKKDFYTRNVLIVAKELLGKLFVYYDKINNVKLVGRIVEVEVYDGKIDKAAHTYLGKTERNKVMFNEGGHLYVYFIYGKHFCANIVTGNKEEGTAILIRALEPLGDNSVFAKRRFNKIELLEKEKINLLNGPAKICQAFKINKENNGLSLLGSEIYLLNSPLIDEKNIVRTSRIGIKKSVDLAWRFYIKGNKFISSK